VVEESTPAFPRRASVATGLAVAILGVALSTALIYPLSEVAPVVSTGVVYMLVVLAVSIYWGLWLGLFTAVASATAFNFFHIPPTGELDVANGENLAALAIFLVAAATVSSLAERSRARVHEAETEALRRSDEAKTALLRAVSHDLRSPLTAIMAAGDALSSQRIEDADRRALADAVAAEAARLSRLVEKLLDLSRLEAGQAQPRLDSCSVDEVVGAAVEDLGDPGRSVRLEIDEDLPFVRADAAQIERALANLLDNAVRASGSEQTLVRAGVVEGRMAISIADRGPGIPADDLDRVFEPFYQRPDGRTHDGSGLGLAIVRCLVEVNDGRVWAESTPGRGAKFVVELPLDPAGGRPEQRLTQEAG
jgi:K+-sensing histidine kinase KdpD